ncbi:acyl-CoA/acyl-ACP dehydrogenase [Sphingomonas sp. So64.6b]|uniref:acyl-CoA dehydrogenase family protein n=1 Tax=Sphingomonas sp. So64.6b TaxID=2997354 RepID=UPI001600A0AE|nr:acyl-CoA dehydrogenase family protein [Sphingomonas sp. So64.6b]QNA86625.1 acyl-CoA/acyl-ACP dehydrogenase [Sphingomonas sp. So64.6b]
MRLAFSDDQVAVRDAVQAFLAEAVSSESTRTAMADGSGVDWPLWRAMARDLGLTGLAVPEAFGGSELGAVETAIISETLGAHLGAVPWLASTVIATKAISLGGSDTQGAEWLPRLAEGSAIATFATEGFEIRNGRLTGSTPFVPHGNVADLIVACADDQTFLVPTDAVGCTITAQTTLDQTRPLALVTLSDVEAAPLPALDWCDIEPLAWTAIAADSLGGAQACLDRTVAHVKERIQFGRTIGSFQAVKHRLADMLVAIEQARSAVYWAAGEIDAGGPDARLASHAAKSFACDTYADCAGHAIQLHGGIGFTWEHDAHLFFKRARGNMSLMGAPVWHREQIARLMPLEVACD